jgi:hypothetical protein
MAANPDMTAVDPVPVATEPDISGHRRGAIDFDLRLRRRDRDGAGVIAAPSIITPGWNDDAGADGERYGSRENQISGISRKFSHGRPQCDPTRPWRASYWIKRSVGLIVH